MKDDIIKDFVLKHRKDLHDLLVEEISTDELPDDQAGVASVDDAIDSFIMSTEQTAQKAAENKNEVYDKRLSRLTGYLVEQEDETEETEEDVVEAVPELDVHYFAKEMARLIHNYDNLLDVPSVIVNRAVNTLLENYSTDVVNEFKEILSENFDIELVMLGQDADKDPEQSAPPAVGAGPISTGGA